MASRGFFKHPGVDGLAFLSRIIEPLLMMVTSAAAYVYRNGFMIYDQPIAGYIGLTFIGILTYALLGHMMLIYNSKYIRDPVRNIPQMMGVLTVAVGVVIVTLFLIKTSNLYSRTWVVVWFIFTLITLSFFRFWVARFISQKVKSGQWCRRIALLGLGGKTSELIRIFREEGPSEIKLTGVYAAPDDEVYPETYKLTLFRGDINELLVSGRRKQFDELIVTCDFDAMPEARAVLNKLRALSVNIYYCLPLSFFGLTMGGEHTIGNVPLVLLMRKPLEGHNLFLKRAVDVLVSLVAMIPFSLLFLVIAPLVKLSSPGPIFFKQKRKGVDGREFGMLKFRSMRVGEPPKDKDGKEKQATEDDPRITPIGRILRRLSLDETPQILNVLKGDMSVVGPRPHAISHDNYYEQLIDCYTSRHKIRPGITGWAQLNGWRGETDTLDKMAKRVEHDIWYIENWNLGLDLKIIFLTPLFMFFQKKAY